MTLGWAVWYVLIRSGQTPFQEVSVEPGATRSETGPVEVAGWAAAAGVPVEAVAAAVAAVVVVGADAVVGAAVAAADADVDWAAGAAVGWAAGVEAVDAPVPLPLQAVNTPARSDEAKTPPPTAINRRRDVRNSVTLTTMIPLFLAYLVHDQPDTSRILTVGSFSVPPC